MVDFNRPPSIESSAKRFGEHGDGVILTAAADLIVWGAQELGLSVQVAECGAAACLIRAAAVAIANAAGLPDEMAEEIKGKLHAVIREYMP
jgi:citrate lyase gamma subunit